MKWDWRAPALFAALFAAWAFAAFAPGCDQKPRPAELIPGRPDRGAYARTLAKARAAASVRSGLPTLLEGAAAFREIDQQDPDADHLPDLDAYCGEVIRWVRGPDAEGKLRPDLADLLEAERVELRREGLLPGPTR